MVLSASDYSPSKITSLIHGGVTVTEERILVVDFSPERRAFKGRLCARFRDVTVSELATGSNWKADTNVAKLEELRAIGCDILIAHIGGNPSGYECLRTFKRG